MAREDSTCGAFPGMGCCRPGSNSCQLAACIPPTTSSFWIAGILSPGKQRGDTQCSGAALSWQRVLLKQTSWVDHCASMCKCSWLHTHQALRAKHPGLQIWASFVLSDREAQPNPTPTATRPQSASRPPSPPAKSGRKQPLPTHLNVVE